MDKIESIKAREILDSRGEPSLEVELTTQNHISAIASVPSGASVGAYEAIELRDNDPSRYNGQGLLKAVSNVEKIIAPALVGLDIEDLKSIDQVMIDLDATAHKSNLGANTILAISVAACKAGAVKQNEPLFAYIAKLSQNTAVKIPIPLFNFIEGAKHADNNLQIQEFLSIGTKETFKENYREASEGFHRLKDLLKDRGLTIAVGHEGGFAPTLPSDEDALRLLQQTGVVKIGLDMAGVIPRGVTLNKLVSTYQIAMLEDPAEEDDFDQWAEITQTLGKDVLIVADDIFSSTVSRLEMGHERGVANAVIVKPNQVGTVTEAIDFVRLAKEKGYKVVASHRSGETEDSFIADFAVGVGADYAKLGAPSRGERVSKYNRLLRIEEIIAKNE